MTLWELLVADPILAKCKVDCADTVANTLMIQIEFNMSENAECMAEHIEWILPEERKKISH